MEFFLNELFLSNAINLKQNWCTVFVELLTTYQMSLLPIFSNSASMTRKMHKSYAQMEQSKAPRMHTENVFESLCLLFKDISDLFQTLWLRPLWIFHMALKFVSDWLPDSRHLDLGYLVKLCMVLFNFSVSIFADNSRVFQEFWPKKQMTSAIVSNKHV